MITSLPVVKPGDPQSLSRFVGRLNDVIANLNRTGQAEELKSTTVVEITTAKLPRDLICLWGEELSRNYKETSLVCLKNWLEIKLMGQRFGDNCLAQAEQRMESGVRGREVPRRVHNTAVRSTGACAICRENHRTQECPTFRNADLTRRNELVKEHRLCFHCLRPGHGFRFCKSKRVCGVDGCRRSHHQDLHERVAPRVNHLRNVQGEAITTESENRVNINTWKHGNLGIALGVVAVQVKDARGRTVTARALIDEGSDASIASREFVRKLGFTKRQLKC